MAHKVGNFTGMIWCAVVRCAVGGRCTRKIRDDVRESGTLLLGGGPGGSTQVPFKVLLKMIRQLMIVRIFKLV